MVTVYPSLSQAVRLANVGITGTGNTERDRVLEISPSGRAYVEAADVCVAAPSQLEAAVLDGLHVTDDQYTWFRRQDVV